MKALRLLIVLLGSFPWVATAQPFVTVNTRLSKATTGSDYIVTWPAIPDVRYFMVWKTNFSQPNWHYGSYAMEMQTNSLAEYRFTPATVRRFSVIKIVSWVAYDITGVEIGPLSATNLLIYPINQQGAVMVTNLPPPVTNSPPVVTNSPPVTNTPPVTERVAMGAGLGPIVDDQTSGSFGSAFEHFYGDSPVYRSTALETNEWADCITVPPGESVALYVRSDDGAAVWVNGVEQHNTFGSGQNWDKPEDSFHFVTCLSGGSSNWILVRYSNTKRVGSGDTDGLTLFVVGDNPTHPRILGDTELDWYGSEGSDNFEYVLNAHAKDNLPGVWTNLVWTTSPHLQITETNEPLQRITVVATGVSVRPGEDWVEVHWVPRCGGASRTNRLNVTITTLRSIVQVGTPIKSAQSGFVSAVYTYRILDQFGRPFQFACFVSEDVYGAVPDGVIVSPPTQNLWVNGLFVERIQCHMTSTTFTRMHVIHAHRERDAFGIWFGWIIWYFEPTDIEPQINSIPGS